MTDKRKDDLEETGLERVTSLGMGAVGALTPVTGIMVRVLEDVMPNRWRHRVNRTLRVLDAKIEGISDEVIEERAKTEGFGAILEEAMFQASRATTEERLEYIANCLKNSLTSDELEDEAQLRLLRLLNQINDAEVIVLKFLAISAWEQADRRAFAEKHADVLHEPDDTLGMNQRGPKVEALQRRGSFYRQYVANLASLGLIRIPAHDEDDHFKSRTQAAIEDTFLPRRYGALDGYEATGLGKILASWIEDQSTISEPPQSDPGDLQ
jgi:hypothetical protein